ncbi:MAG: PhnD/SsuA/transferrin family substrate-binding protein [bacterium]
MLSHLKKSQQSSIYLTIFSILLLWLCTFAQDAKRPSFLIVKPGDAGATSESASEYLNKIGEYFSQKVSRFKQKPLLGLISNRLDSAIVILQKHRPVFVFVPAGFYLQHLSNYAENTRPIAQAPRFGKQVEHYYLLGLKRRPSSLAALKGQRVRTNFAIDWAYLKRVVFPADFQPGTHFKLEASENLADDLFLMLEARDAGEIDQLEPAAAILVDEELKHFFETDDLIRDELQILWTSPPLPRDLFVLIGNDWSTAEERELLHALIDMNQDALGQELLSLMQSSGITEIDSTLLAETAAKYFTSEKGKRE